jgi:hypothetical protein
MFEGRIECMHAAFNGLYEKWKARVPEGTMFTVEAYDAVNTFLDVGVGRRDFHQCMASHQPTSPNPHPLPPAHIQQFLICNSLEAAPSPDMMGKLNLWAQAICDVDLDNIDHESVFWQLPSNFRG